MPTPGNEPPAFLASQVVFDGDGDGRGQVVTPLRALTDYRICHEGQPREARVVYACTTQPHPSSSSAAAAAPTEDCVLKIKVQVPNPDTAARPAAPSPGPSDTTAHELAALQRFRDAGAGAAPQLRGFKTAVQGADGPLPGGYVTYSLMTAKRGATLFDSGFWGRAEAEREEIGGKFLGALRELDSEVYALGVRPLDRALRNIMWDVETRTCIIDFEMWAETDSDAITDETKELQRWGLARSSPQKWWDAWFEAEGHG